tara:strand:- start:613 stop:990 length:378 start_codon:yes stop_codon:yes gene_type:complete
MTIKKQDLASNMLVRFVLADENAHCDVLYTSKNQLRMHLVLSSIFTARNELQQDEQRCAQTVRQTSLQHSDMAKIFVVEAEESQLLVVRANPDSQPNFSENERKRWLVEYLGLERNGTRLFIGRF